MWFRDSFNAKDRRKLPVKPSSPGGDGMTLSALALRQMDRLHISRDQTWLENRIGARASHRRRPAADFFDHRQYIQGDDIRFVDWKASARQEHIFIKQGALQKSVTVYVLLDCSASMAWGDVPKSQAGLLLANALSYMALAQNDRVVILPITSNGSGQPVRPLGPLWGKGQAILLADYLRSLQFQGQIDITNSLIELTRNKQSQGGVVFVISDLLAVQSLSPALEMIRAPAWKIIFLHLLHPDELQPDLQGHFELHDIETGEKRVYKITPQALGTYQRRLQTWQAKIAQVCLQHRCQYTLIPSNWSLEKEILPHLRRLQVVKPN
ncbi:MAG: DUF58 domain-containing protein [Anaerolineae bacterium]|nr:DUF58 domain-containing protein [Anaerolineae bacterium]